MKYNIQSRKLLARSRINRPLEIVRYIIWSILILGFVVSCWVLVWAFAPEGSF